MFGKAWRAAKVAVRQQVRWWRFNAKREALHPDPPPRNAYPGLAWDSPVRRAQTEAVLEQRGALQTGRVFPSWDDWARETAAWY